jgi:hypothetical protein
MREQQLERTATAESTPALNIIFDGLFFFCFNNGGNPPVPAGSDLASECRIGFLTTAPGHKITISGVRTIPVGNNQSVTESFNFNLKHREARMIGNISLDVPGVTTPSVRRRGYTTSFNRLSNPSPPSDSFQWIVDLEQAPLHATKLTLVPGVLKPVMRVNIGEFYTESLSDVPYNYTKVDEDPRLFGKMAERTGLIIATLPQKKASLNIGDLSLPLVEKEGATCKVTIKNRCPALEGVRETLNQLKLRPVLDGIMDVLNCLSFSTTPEDIKDILQQVQASDFPFYYQAFDVKVRGQFDFEPIDPKRSFPPAVCYVASGSETTDI